MKKLEVSKILFLAGMSVTLMACGQVSSDMSDAGTKSDSYSLKSKSDGQNTVPTRDGGQGYKDPDGGQGFVEEKPYEDGGQGLQDPDGGQGFVEEKDPVKDGGQGLQVPDGGQGFVEEKPYEDGGQGLSATLVDTIFYIKGSVDKEIASVGLIINGKEQYIIDVKDGFFEFKVELAKEDFESMSVHLVIGKEVKTYMVLKGELQEVKYTK